MAKNILLGLICTVFGFVIAWFVKPAPESINEITKKEIVKSKPKGETKERKKLVEEEIEELPEFDASETDFSKVVTGKFVLKGADWSGFDFRSKKEIYWTAELFPNDPDICRLKWIDKSNFLIIRNSTEDNCPPNIDVFRVQSYNGKKLVIRWFDTSGTWKDEDHEYYPVDEFFNDRK